MYFLENKVHSCREENGLAGTTVKAVHWWLAILQKIKAKSTSDAIVQYEDILPTLMEFVGGDEIEGIDGKSFLKALFGKEKEHRRFAYGIHNNIPEGTAYPIRSIRDKRYKLILNLTPEVEYFEKHLMNLKNEKKRLGKLD